MQSIPCPPKHLIPVVSTVPQQGSFGTVIEFQHKTNGTRYAVKKVGVVLFNNKLRTKGVKHILREVQNLSTLQHKRIVKYHAHWFEGPDSEIFRKFETSPSTLPSSYLDDTDNFWVPADSGPPGNPVNFLCIQMEFCELTLKDWLKSRPTQELRDLEEIYFIFLQVMEGLKYLHNPKRNIFHRDIKPANILIKPLPNKSIGKTLWDVKLGDFGLACDNKLDQTKSINGTGRYMSPEMRSGIYSTPADIFCAGITFFETRLVVTNDMWVQAQSEIMRCGHFQGLLYDLITEETETDIYFISKLTSNDPNCRPDANEAYLTLKTNILESKFVSAQQLCETDASRASQCYLQLLALGSWILSVRRKLILDRWNSQSILTVLVSVALAIVYLFITGNAIISWAAVGITLCTVAYIRRDSDLKTYKTYGALGLSIFLISVAFLIAKIEPGNLGTIFVSLKQSEEIQMFQSLQVGDEITPELLQQWKDLGSYANPFAQRVTKMDMFAPKRFADSTRVVIHREIVHKTLALYPIRPTYKYEVPHNSGHCFATGAAAIDIANDSTSPDVTIIRKRDTNDLSYLFQVKAQPFRGHSLVLIVIGYCE